jgi:flagellar motility protein MotE (MotC chaperone)
METIIYFGLGIFTSIVVFLVGYASLGVFRLNKKVNELNEFIEVTDRRISDVERDIYQTIDDTARDIYQRIDEVQSNLDEAERDLVSFVDSRFDKLENKLKDQIASGAEVRKIIEENEKTKQRLDDFIRNYQSL